MQKSFPIALIVGASIIATALFYHGRQLAEVSRQLQAMEQRTTALDNRLDQFSNDLPHLVEQAGSNAGRQAVHGMVEEVVQMPFNWLRPKSASGASNALNDAASPLPSSGPRKDTEVEIAPLIRFDIRDPVVRIEILPNLKEVPAVPWFAPASNRTDSVPQTGSNGGTVPHFLFDQQPE